MPRSRLLFVLPLAFSVAVQLGCSKDSPTAATPTVTFPTLPAALLTAYCVQGQKQPNQPISGTLAATDCPLGDGSFYEMWHVRVTTSGNYAFAASSTFDNLLYLLHLDSYTNTTASLTQIAADDDGGGGTNALITGVALTSGTDYFLVVNGYDSTDVGPYTVTFSGP